MINQGRSELDIEIALLLPQFARGQLSAQECLRVEKALANSTFLQTELEEIRSLSKSAHPSEGAQVLGHEPSHVQLESMLRTIRQTPQNPPQQSVKKNGFAWFKGIFFRANNYQVKPTLMHAGIALIAAQTALMAGLFWQNTHAQKDELNGQERLITRLAPQIPLSDISVTLSQKNLAVAAFNQNNDLILISKVKLPKGALANIGHDMESAGVAQFAIYSEGDYLRRPLICRNYKSDSQFESRPALSDTKITNVFSTIETIEGRIYGQTRNGPSAINLANLGPDGGWIGLSARSVNPAIKDSWKLLYGRFENDIDTELTKDNVPLVRLGLEVLLGNEDGLYPGKYIGQTVNGPLNVKYVNAVYNLPGQAKITGFEIKICGHKK